MQEGQAQLGADGTGPEQVACQLFSAVGAIPGAEIVPQRDWPLFRRSPGSPSVLIFGGPRSQEYLPLAGGWVKPMAGEGEVA